jgi:hypothetical protein
MESDEKKIWKTNNHVTGFGEFKFANNPVAI